jgi:hypothetical protein
VDRFVLAVADQFYFIAHDDRAGQRRLHARVTALGLAAALLGELVMLDRVRVHDGAVLVVRREPPADALAHQILTELVSQPHYTDVRIWLAYVAEFAIDGVARRLERARALMPVRQRRLARTRTVWVPTDINQAAWQAIRLERMLNSRAWLPPADGFLAGLIAATGLTRHVLWDTDRSAIGLAHLPQVVRGLPPSLLELVSYTEAAVGQFVLAPH